MNKSRKEISSLMKLQPEEAWRLQDDGSTIRVSVSELVLGDRLVVRPGERIPADGVIISGSTAIDEAAISGESIPVSKFDGDELFAGTVNISGAITMEMTKANEDSLFQKIIDLVQTAQNEKSPAQQFIERFESTYVKVVLLAVVVMMFLPSLFTRMGLDYNFLPCNGSTSCSFSMCTRRCSYASNSCSYF